MRGAAGSPYTYTQITNNFIMNDEQQQMRRKKRVLQMDNHSKLYMRHANSNLLWSLPTAQQADIGLYLVITRVLCIHHIK